MKATAKATWPTNYTGTRRSSFGRIVMIVCLIIGIAASHSYGQSYCIPAQSSGYNVYGISISNVTTSGGISNFTNTTGLEPSSYGNYSSTQIASQAQNSPLTISATNVGAGMSYSIYVDYNDNGVFTDEGELVLQMGNSFGGTISGSFIIPADAPLGTHRLRVRADYSGNDYPQGPCTQLLYGETEDYGLTVTVPCIPPTIQATIGNFASNSSGDKMTVNWTRGNGTGGILVVGRLTSSSLTDPAGSVSYPADVNLGSGAEMGTGNFVVYNGTGTSVNVTGLTPGASYTFTCYEYNDENVCYKTPGSAQEVTAGYCIPAQSSAYNPYGISISNVTTSGGISNFTNTTGLEPASYGNYSSTQIVSQAHNASLTISATNVGAGMSYSIYVDYNDNGVFTDEGELVLQMGNTTPGTISGSFTIRSDAPLGTHRLRVRADYSGNDYPQGPCTQLQYGETEDYGLTVTESCTPPTTQATIGNFINTSGEKMTVNWTRGNGTGGILVVGRLTSSTLIDPAGSVSYTANTLFGSGTQIGNGNFVVYNGTGTSVDVTGLTPGGSYTFTCYEYNSANVCYKTPGSAEEVTAGYCIPAQSFYYDNNPGMSISNVTTIGGISNFTNTTGLEPASYGNYSSTKIASQAQNSALTISAMNESRGMSYSIYVDYNDNGVFTDEGELVLQMGNTAPGTISGSFTIRSDASLGTHRLRVRADYYGNDYPQGPCTQLQFGETEDYGLTVIASCAQPTTQATIGSYSYNPIENNTTVNWTRGNGTGGILVVGRLTSSILTDPAGSLSYTANSNFGSGTDIGTGNFVVYNGTGTSVKVTGLIKGASYAFTCYEYNNTGTCYKIPGSTSEIVVGYCVPPPSEYANWFPFYLKNVSTMGGLTNFSNTTGPEGNSYGDYSSNQIAVAVRNTQVILSGTSNRWGMEYTVFVDYNDNGVFDNEGELVLHMVSENEGTISGSFTIPVNAPLGTHRMRVKGEEYGTPYNPDPCAQLESGETEDYGLTILAPCIQPTTQASALSISNTTSTQTDVNWTNGSGDGRMVVARLNSTAAIAPSHGTSYVANTVFGSGNTTGAGNFVVFSGAGSGPVTVTGLSAGKAYTFTVYEFNNTRECYLLSGLSDSIITPLLTSSTLTGFSTVCQGSTTGPNSFTITGTNLSSADVTVAALPGFTYSETPGGIYSTTLSFLQPGGSCSKQIFVKFSPTAAQSYNGNIVVSGGGASGVNVAATGKGAEIPVVTATPTSETILSGFATDINLSSQIGGTTFVWGEPVISGSINGASAGSGSTISQTLTNTGESAGTVTYNITTFATCTSSVTSVVITVEAPVPMAYTSSNTVQLNNGTVLYPSTTTNIIQMQVVTTGGASPFNMTSMAFSTNGTTNASKDIANAKVYYTGTSPVFATTTQFGSTYNNPNGSFTVKGNQPLSAGINYFWLSYELPSTPNLGDAIDGCFTQFVMSGAGGTQTPATTCPAGNATINSDYCIPQQSINYQSGSFYLTNISTTGGITNFTSYPDSYYSNSYANYSASKIASQAQNSPITLNLGYYSDYGMYEFYYYVYIDFNDNGVFSDPGEMYATQVSEDGSTTSITFTIPADAPVGTHRMRVRADILSRVYDECSQLYYGETDDYGLTVTAACTATITPGGSTALCQGESVMLTSNPGASYVWSTGATTQFITVSSAGDYAVNVTNADGCSSTSTATTVTVSQPETWYLDADNDGHYVSSQSSCGSPGAGYNTTATISGDCDDNDATKWQSTLVYVDADADGYTVGEATSICYGETIPSGYSTTSLGTDCDDNNPSIQTGQTWYLDADNDGHYVSSQSSCSSPGEGYNITATQIGDCDDSNPNKWQSALLYVDFDGDGYTVGAATSVCYGATVPPGYAVTTSGSDYNDGDPSIHQNTVISGIDASSSSNPVALGSGAILSATISPAISGVTVTFSVDPGTGVTTTYTAVTNSSGIATTAPVSGLSVNLYKVIATAGGVTSDAAYLAVYDPNSSFITGGGWIISPVGALIAQPLLSGKANFGFVAKYKKGKSEVDGDTEFQFQNGDFNFESSALNAGSLVISGSKGTYRGEGTVNGQGNYGFMVSAVDGQISGSGGTDLFRIKIWNKSNGNSVVYDNNTGKDENGVPSTTLGGGSIVIHTAKGKNSRVMNTGTKVEITNSSSEELTGTGKLTVTVMPNPTSYYFTLDMKSLSKEKIKVTVTDIVGRVIEQRTGIPANSTIQLAHQYHPGVYIAQFLQGNDKVTIRLIKEGK